MDARDVAAALAMTAHATNEWAGTQTAAVLVREALTVLGDDQVAAAVRTATALPQDVARALERDAQDVTTTLSAGQGSYLY